MLLHNAWLLGCLTLVIINSVAVYDVSLTTCGYRYPILLSRALTTDPYRGYTLGYCLLAIAASYGMNSSVLSTAFLGFYSAFLVSMFETSAHNTLILVSSGLILWECYPYSSYTDSSFFRRCQRSIFIHPLWAVHWWVTILLLLVCIVWLVYADWVYTGLDSKCSIWYVSEYLLFWSMYLLVYWKIPKDTQLRDKIWRNADRRNTEQENLQISPNDQNLGILSKQKQENPGILSKQKQENPGILF